MYKLTQFFVGIQKISTVILFNIFVKFLGVHEYLKIMTDVRFTIVKIMIIELK